MSPTDKTRWSGWTMLHRAAEEGQTDICQLLIESGAKINARTTWGWHTPLHLALSNGWKETALLLHEYGCDVNCRNKELKDPMQYGKDKGHKQVTEEFHYLILLKGEIRLNELRLENKAEG